MIDVTIETKCNNVISYDYNIGENHMTYDYNSKIYLAEAVLNVKDLAASDGDGLLHTDCWTWNPNSKRKGKLF